MQLEENRSDQVEVTGVNLMGFAKSVRFNQFYHYSGSLTTPPYTEVNFSTTRVNHPVVAGVLLKDGEKFGNPTVYHMFQSVHSPMRSLVTKVN